MEQQQQRIRRRHGRSTEPLQAVIGVRLPVGLVQTLRRQADQEDRPVSYLVRNLVLTAYEQQQRGQRVGER